jgi:hypothetical protein
LSIDFRRGGARWILPVAILTASSFLYANAAVDLAAARVIPGLLERSVTTESDLTHLFRASIRTASLILPLVLLLFTTLISWWIVRAGTPAWTFGRVWTLVTHAGLFISAGLLVKALLVLVTKEPDPPVHLGYWIPARTPVRAALLSLTNPFLVAAILFCVRGFRNGGVPGDRAAFAGSAPWIFLMILFAVSGSRGIVPEAASISEGWRVLDGNVVTLRHPPGIEVPGRNLSLALDEFAGRLAEKIGSQPPPLRIDLFPDHASLERATGESLPVEVTGSIRGAGLLYLEAPGKNPAVPESRAFQDAARYVAILQLAPLAFDAPRWFVEGLAHAEAFRYSEAVDLAYVSALRRRGASFQTMHDPAIYRTAEGPLLARGLLDYLAYRHGGRETIDGLLRDLIAGKTFRDALFERTRLTMSALESEWQESARSILDHVAATDPRAASDSTGQSVPLR